MAASFKAPNRFALRLSMVSMSATEECRRSARAITLRRPKNMLATRSAYGFQSFRGLVRCLLKTRAFTFGDLVDEIESHRRSLEPISPILNRPNGTSLWQFIYQCLKEWISL